MRLILLFFFLHAFHVLTGQNLAIDDYSAQAIPEELKKGADVVYRLDETTLEIHSPSRYFERVHQVITILNKAGANYLRQLFWFDRFHKIDAIDITIYNSQGQPVQKHRKNDFMMHNYYDGISLVTDDRLLHLQLSTSS